MASYAGSSTGLVIYSLSTVLNATVTCCLSCRIHTSLLQCFLPFYFYEISVPATRVHFHVVRLCYCTFCPLLASTVCPRASVAERLQSALDFFFSATWDPTVREEIEFRLFKVCCGYLLT
jgi:hypothetical protein